MHDLRFHLLLKQFFLVVQKSVTKVKNFNLYSSIASQAGQWSRLIGKLQLKLLVKKLSICNNMLLKGGIFLYYMFILYSPKDY